MRYTEKYEAVIGIEVHARLATRSKIFCSCSTRFGAPANTQVCPVCMGLPGILPVLNREAVRLAVIAGIATNCSISRVVRFDRKNYFYPDLPKAYQITQNDEPLCRDGYLDVCVNGSPRRIGIQRIHMEEDAGKLAHVEGVGTLVDYNRCGLPLIEIVSRPDIRSTEEAKTYLTELRSVLLYAGVSDCKMNEGSFRCDVNLSVRKTGETALGVRTEMKNINSFAFVAKAIEYEFERQASALERGETILPETRRFDETDGKTYPMRSKETAADYRFFSEPDLAPFELDQSFIEAQRQEMPPLPADIRRIYTEEYGLSAADAEIIISHPQTSRYFSETVKHCKHPKTAANIMISRLLTDARADEFSPSVTPEQLGEITELFAQDMINSSTVKTLLTKLQDSELSPREFVEKQGLWQINDEETLRAVVLDVIKAFPKLINDYKNGKTAARQAIIGKVMAATNGKANPVVVNAILSETYYD